jgi:hypothetical protein
LPPLTPVCDARQVNDAEAFELTVLLMVVFGLALLLVAPLLPHLSFDQSYKQSPLLIGPVDYAGRLAGNSNSNNDGNGPRHFRQSPTGRLVPVPPGK